MKFAARFSLLALSLFLVTACGKFATDTSTAPATTPTADAKTEGSATVNSGLPVGPWSEEKSAQLEADLKTLEAGTPDESWTEQQIDDYDVVLVRTEAMIKAYAADISKLDATLPAQIGDLTKKRRALIDAVRKVHELDQDVFGIEV